MPTATLQIGDTARVQFAFLDEDHAVETPTALTITVRAPSYPDTADTSVDQDAATVTLGKVLPLADRTALAGAFPAGIDIAAADLAAGTGVVEYLHTPDEAGLWQYVIAATSPTVSAQRAYVRVQTALE